MDERLAPPGGVTEPGLPSSPRHVGTDSPIRSVFTVGRRPFLRTFALNIGGNTQSYIFQVFMGSYLIQTVGVDRRLVPQALLVGALFGCASAFVTGVLTDRFGRRPVIIAVVVFLVVFPAPAFLMLDTGNTALIVLVIVLGFVFAAYGTVGSQAASSRPCWGVGSLRCSPVLVQLLAGWVGVVIYMTAIRWSLWSRRFGCRRPAVAISSWSRTHNELNVDHVPQRSAGQQGVQVLGQQVEPAERAPAGSVRCDDQVRGVPQRGVRR